MNRKPNRYNAARDAHDAAMRNPPKPSRRASDARHPVARLIFRALVCAVVVAAILSFAGII